MKKLFIFFFLRHNRRNEASTEENEFLSQAIWNANEFSIFFRLEFMDISRNETKNRRKEPSVCEIGGHWPTMGFKARL